MALSFSFPKTRQGKTRQGESEHEDKMLLLLFLSITLSKVESIRVGKVEPVLSTSELFSAGVKPRITEIGADGNRVQERKSIKAWLGVRPQVWRALVVALPALLMGREKKKKNNNNKYNKTNKKKKREYECLVFGGLLFKR